MKIRLLGMIVLLSIAFIATFSILFINVTVSAQDQNQAPAFVKIYVYVNNTGGGTAKPSDFEVSTGGGEPLFIKGSDTGTIVSYKPGHVIMGIDNPTKNGVPYGLQISGDCKQSSIQYSVTIDVDPGSRKTCYFSMDYPNF